MVVDDSAYCWFGYYLLHDIQYVICNITMTYLVISNYLIRYLIIAHYYYYYYYYYYYCMQRWRIT